MASDSHNSDIASPCISVCEMDSKNNLCKGCFRTIEEIRHWRHSSNEERQALVSLLHERRVAVTGKRARRLNRRRADFLKQNP